MTEFGRGFVRGGLLGAVGMLAWYCIDWPALLKPGGVLQILGWSLLPFSLIAVMWTRDFTRLYLGRAPDPEKAQERVDEYPAYFLTIGAIFTSIGFIGAFGSFNPGQSPEELFSALLESGVLQALYTTVFGAAGYLAMGLAKSEILKRRPEARHPS